MQTGRVDVRDTCHRRVNRAWQVRQ